MVCVGASHAFGGTGRAADRLAGLVRPGGRLLFGEMFWERVPDADRLSRMWPGTSVEEMPDLDGLVGLGVAAGLRPLRVEVVERSEWDDFESGFLADKETWLLANPGHPKAAEVREQADRHRSWWLAGHRGVVGFAYVTFGRPVRLSGCGAGARR